MLDHSPPIFRIFDCDKAVEFYIDWIRFSIDGKYTFGENFPLYSIISLGDLKIHLSEHHDDCSPGASIHIEGLKVCRIIINNYGKKI